MSVADAQGNPVAFADIDLHRADGLIIDSDRTELTGETSFQVPLKGDYEVIVSKIAFADARAPFSVDQPTLNLVLSDNAIQEGDTIAATATAQSQFLRDFIAIHSSYYGWNEKSSTPPHR